MSESEQTRGSAQQGQVDSELDMRGIVWSTIGVLGVTLAAAVLMWGFMAVILDALAAGDPPPPALEEARQPYLPPAPRLQTTPFTDLDALRAEEERQLGSYGWINEPGGIAQIPIDRAIDLLVEKGSVEPLLRLQPGTETDPAGTADGTAGEAASN